LLIRPDFMRIYSSRCPHVNVHDSAVKNNHVPAVRVNTRAPDMWPVRQCTHEALECQKYTQTVNVNVRCNLTLHKLMILVK
jgi:hypothetical protein